MKKLGALLLLISEIEVLLAVTKHHKLLGLKC
jgi:hypothetical protein